jgi:hypothetical protein
MGARCRRDDLVVVEEQVERRSGGGRCGNSRGFRGGRFGGFDHWRGRSGFGDGRRRGGRGSVAAEQRILRQLLDLDTEEPARGSSQLRGLKGVRKAQVKLAVYYISVGAEANARMIAADMRDDPPELKRSVCDDLARAVSPHFWEIVDRGTNFEYLPENERVQLDVFFSWLAGPA